MMRQMMGSMPGMPGMRRQSKSRGKAKKKGKGGGRPVGAGRGPPQSAKQALEQLAGLGPDGAAVRRQRALAAVASALVRAAASPAALPGLGSLPGLAAARVGPAAGPTGRFRCTTVQAARRLSRPARPRRTASCLALGW